MADATNLPPCVATAPPRIWLQVNPEDDADLDLPFPHGEEVTWCSTEVGGAEVEYTRTDLVPRLDRATLDDLLDRLERAVLDSEGALWFDTREDITAARNDILGYCCPETTDHGH